MEDDEQVAYYDEITGYFYDCDGFFIEILPDTGSQEGDQQTEAVEQAEIANAQEDL